MRRRRTPKAPKATAGSLEERGSGILLHPTSLPNRYPVGDLGPAAYEFADFLSECGQRWWQMLPLGPAGPGNSPYQAYSAFAGNPLLISPDRLHGHDLLRVDDLRVPPGPPHRVDYAAAWRFKETVLRRAFDTFHARATPRLRSAFQAFCRAERRWLDDYALFSALRNAQKGAHWLDWTPDLRARRPEALRQARRALATEVEYHQFLQWQFVTQWEELKGYCAERGIGLIGDIPIFVAMNSADVWAHKEFFHLRPEGRPEVVAGVPPDYFSRTGQLWGNPHYDWEELKRRRYGWWIERFRMMFRYFDVVRIDHFIGFVRYYEVPGEARTAEGGRYRPGPGADFFETVFRVMGPLQFIAEDLGTVTAEVKALRDRFGLPGMRVLQFAFGKDPEARTYQPHRYVRRCVVYTGTHDNDTTVGWFNDRSGATSTRSARDVEEERAFALRYLGSDGREIHWDMIRAALMSVGDTAIAPLQDVLGLGSEARMNRPGVPEGNWEWRLEAGQITPEIKKRLREMTQTYGRA